jgi:ribonuclease P protein component
MLPRAHRLLGETTFREILATGQRWSTPDVSLHARCVATGAPSGLGFIVSRRALKRAVDRNAFKRRIRGAFRSRFTARPGLQLVVRLRRTPQPGAIAAAQAVAERFEEIDAWFALRSASFASTATP